MPQTPDTLSYLVLGLCVVFGVSGAFVLSMLLRYRSLTGELRRIERYKASK